MRDGCEDCVKHPFFHHLQYCVIGSHCDGSWIEGDYSNKDDALMVAKRIHERSREHAESNPASVSCAAVFYGNNVVARCC